MTESVEELKSLLMRVKNSEKAGLKLNIKKKKKKTKIMASSPIISWQILIEGKKGGSSNRFYFLGLKICRW